jgi:predicted nucleotidyltransferase
MNTLLLYDCITGSRAYNLVSPTSDTDTRRIVTPTDLDYFFGMKSFDVGNVVTTQENDSTDYSLRRFIQLAMTGNTIMLELLFAPQSVIKYMHPLFHKYFFLNKKEFVTKELYKVMRGYAIAEFRRTIGETTRMLGKERKEDIEKYGYSAKNASHCIRILHCATEALNTGVYPVWLTGPIQDMCYALKTYAIPKDQFMLIYEYALVDLDKAYYNSVLPESVDENFMNDILVRFYAELFHMNEYAMDYITQKTARRS